MRTRSGLLTIIFIALAAVIAYAIARSRAVAPTKPGLETSPTPSPIVSPETSATPTSSPGSSPTTSPSPLSQLIILDSPKEGSAISSPVKVSGKARGNWFFEATFPVVLTDWDGLIIAEGFATADGEWMTTEFVPFTAELTFTKPTYSDRGTLVLKKANTSGLPQNDAAHEITVYFK